MQETHTTESMLDKLYDELRGLAKTRLSRERPGHTLQPTALVHEVYLRLSPDRNGRDGWDERSQFLSAAANVMRRILVDHARRQLARKRAGTRRHNTLDEIAVDLPLPPHELVAIHDSLEQYAIEEPVKAQLVTLRVFAGLSHRQAAETLGLSRATADRYWSVAKVRLSSMIR